MANTNKHVRKPKSWKLHVIRQIHSFPANAEEANANSEPEVVPPPAPTIRGRNVDDALQQARKLCEAKGWPVRAVQMAPNGIYVVLYDKAPEKRDMKMSENRRRYPG